jgi:uncharacterized membrane protein
MSTPTHSGDGLTLGPVQMLVVGFEGDNFSGEIREELERLKEHDIVRLIDLLLVKKNDDGDIEVLQTSDLDQNEAEEFGAVVGALGGFGAGSAVQLPAPRRLRTDTCSTTTLSGT